MLVQILVGLLLVAAGLAVIVFRVRQFKRKKDPVVLKIIENLIFLEILGGAFLIFFGALALGQVILKLLS